MLYRVTLDFNVEIDSEFITDVADELEPLFSTLRIMIKENLAIDLAPRYRCEMVSVDPRTNATQAINGQWLEYLIS